MVAVGFRAASGRIEPDEAGKVAQRSSDFLRGIRKAAAHGSGKRLHG
jgi:hypothetical protein